MGNTKSVEFVINDNPNRLAFVTFKSWRTINSTWGAFVVFTYTIRYYRFTWDIEFRYNDIVRLDRALFPIFSDQLSATHRPAKFNKIFWTHDQEFLTTRSKMMLKYIQDILDVQAAMNHQKMRAFLNISVSSFNPNLGRKGKEGYLKKSSGGYVEGFSRQVGDYFQVWMWRWIVLHDTCISWYKSPEDPEPRGTLMIDRKFNVQVVGRVITVTTATRKMLLHAPTQRSAAEWVTAMRTFYAGSTRSLNHFFDAAFPPRMNCDVKVYTYTRDYYNSLALALLSAQTEILITSWKNSPTVLLTRPPYPTLRLDQILKYKAEQGVKIYILLYKEVEYVGQGNDSLRSKTYLEGLSPNIRVIRHPNKFIGGSTAMLWSHHEKSVVIDRNLCFVGGVDLAFQRWDDELKRVSDEDGVLYPGHDYRNPAPGLFKPLRTPPVKDPNNPNPDDEDEFIEVEIAVPGEQLPTATTAALDGDDVPYEVEVVVDFGVAAVEYPALTAATVAAHTASTSAARTQSTGVASSPATPAATPAAAPALAVAPPEPTSATNTPQSRAKVGGGTPSTRRGSVRPEGAALDESDKMSDESEGWAEDRFVPETAEEREARVAAGADGEHDEVSSQVDPNEVSGRGSVVQGNKRNSTRSSFYDDLKSGLESSKASIRSSLEFLGAQIQTAKEMYTRHVAQKSIAALEPREVYPRMPWHDVQASVTGLVARDVASHFVQRWNHHRISNSQYSEPILHDITDNTEFGVCARCVRACIKETETICPDCGYYLGPGSSFSQPTDSEFCPPFQSDYSYIVFECKYPGKLPLPFRMVGDCPVVVTAILQNTIKTSSRDNIANAATLEGNLVDLQGPQAEWLHSMGLVPAIGDIVVAVDNTVVTHLNSNQCKRLLKKKRTEIRNFLSGRAFVDLEDEPTITVQFRRHYLENLCPADKKLDDGASEKFKEALHDRDVAAASGKGPATAPLPVPAPTGNRILTEEELAALERAESGQSSAVPPPPAAASTSAPAVSSATEMKRSEDDEIAGGSEVAFSYGSSPSSTRLMGRPSVAAIPIRDADVEIGKGGVSAPIGSGGDGGEGGAGDQEAIPTVSAVPITATAMPIAAAGDVVGGNIVQNNADKARQFHPACAAAAQLEVKLAMSTLFHTFYRGIETPSRLWDGTGTCKVQLLRSIGKWSTGTKEEVSIQNCYIDTINNAKHFIYIENQFFVSSCAGPDVSNGIAAALVNRICQAHTANENFRVVIIIPMHPNGDFSAAKKAQVVMHYEYATINRGVNSMFEQLRRRAPNITISNYIGFYSLRNWGIINNKVVSEQVYVHDKVMIVDDRVVIIGSANINDRSMLGERDSELAIRIEDTLHCSITMNGEPFVVGFLPHQLRTRLMRQHLGENETYDCSDPLAKPVRDFWKFRANSNSAIYDQIDGGTSVYRCTTIGQWKDAFATYVNPSYLDPTIKHTMSEIKGFLVDWPQTLFEREDLAPTLALRTVIPNALWV